MPLTSSRAQVVLDRAEARARELGVRAVVALVDAGAHLKAFRRMDGAVLGSNDLAIRKATTAILFQANSDAVWEYCKPGGAAPALELSNGGLAPFGGGVPLRDPDGEFAGAVGISGGSVEQDLKIAHAAAAAFRDQ